jgi:hypothetical protein
MLDNRIQDSKSGQQLELDENGFENQKLLLLIKICLIFFMI